MTPKVLRVSILMSVIILAAGPPGMAAVVSRSRSSPGGTTKRELPRPSSEIESLSITTHVQEQWNFTWNYADCNDTTPLVQDDVTGVSVTLNLTISQLKNATTSTPILPSTAGLRVFQNGTAGWQDLGAVDDVGAGAGTFESSVMIPSSWPGEFYIDAIPRNLTAVTYSAYLFMNGSSMHDPVATIHPEQAPPGDTLEWALDFSSPFCSSGQFRAWFNVTPPHAIHRVYKRAVTQHWTPIEYQVVGNHVIVDEGAPEFRAVLRRPNYVDVDCNANLTVGAELGLYVYCSMTGTITVHFEDPEGNELLAAQQPVTSGEVVAFGWTMPFNVTAGVSPLRVTLANGTAEFASARYVEVFFDKPAMLGAFTANTTCFSQYLVGCAFYDSFRYMFHEPWFWIANASVTYEFLNLTGPLEFMEIEEGLWFYVVMIDLEQVIVPAGSYEITFRAEKLGYGMEESTILVEVAKSPINITCQLLETRVAVEEIYSVTAHLTDDVGADEMLGKPVDVRVSLASTQHGVVEEHLVENIYQVLPLTDIVSNTTRPGNYTLTLAVESPYYAGNGSVTLQVEKKGIALDATYETTITSDTNASIQWHLEAGAYNLENMTLVVSVDDAAFQTIPVPADLNGTVTVALVPGNHTIRLDLQSPYYQSTRVIHIASITPPAPPPTFWETYWWVVVLLVVLGVVLGIVLAWFKRKNAMQEALRRQRRVEAEILATQTRVEALDAIQVVFLLRREGIALARYEVTDTGLNEQLVGGMLTALNQFLESTVGSAPGRDPGGIRKRVFCGEVGGRFVEFRLFIAARVMVVFVSSRDTTPVAPLLEPLLRRCTRAYASALKAETGDLAPFSGFPAMTQAFLAGQRDALRQAITKLEKGEA